MTLVTAIKASGAIIMASDSRTINAQTGLLDDTAQKLFPLGNFVLGLSGNDIGLSLPRIHYQNLLKSTNSIEQLANAIAVYFSSSCYSWFENFQPAQWPPMTFILGRYGYEMEGQESEPVIYTFHQATCFAPELAGKMPVLAGMIVHASYMCKSQYQPGMDLPEAIWLSNNLIQETEKTTPSVGGPVQMYKIMDGTIPIKLSPQEIVSLSRPVIPTWSDPPRPKGRGFNPLA